MSNVEKLISIRKNIIDKLITKSKIEKIKIELLPKKSLFKNIFEHIFLKSFKVEKLETIEEMFFIRENLNVTKTRFFVSITTLLFSLSFFHLLNKEAMTILLLGSFSTVFTLIFLTILNWNLMEKKIKAKFNSKDIDKIKENLFNNYNKEELKLLLGESLTKKQLSETFKELESIVSENEIVNIFTNLEEKKSDDITESYNLLLTINKIIEVFKKEENNKKQENTKEKNKNIIKLLKKETKIEEVKTYS